MQLFQLKLDSYEAKQIAEFQKDNFVGMDWPSIGNLENVSKEEWMGKYVQDSNQVQGHEVFDSNNLFEHVDSFVYAMQDGDYLLAAAADTVHFADLGEYYYLDAGDSDEVNLRHRRGVTWMKSLLRDDLPMELQHFLNQPEQLSKFEREVTYEQLERWLTNPMGNEQEAASPIRIDRSTVEEALDILKQAMRSDDLDRRERAAIAILRYAK